MPWYDAHRISPELRAHLAREIGADAAAEFRPERYRFWYDRAGAGLRWRRLAQGTQRADEFEAEGWTLIPEGLRDECSRWF